ncbi:MAG: hypothetical protein KDA68_07685, partial [Planctomycetaceae bacterium]|nr:hypothetical protein [Planctomycetaceae bacterium]
QFGTIDVYHAGVHLGHFTNVRQFRANFGDGDDVLHFSAVRMAAVVKINMGGGADTFLVDNTPTIGPSPDDHARLSGKVNIQMGNDPGDFISLNSNSATHGIYFVNVTKMLGAADVNFFGTGGTNNLEFEDVYMTSSLIIKLAPHGDVNGDGANLLFQDVIAGKVRIFGAKGPDEMRIYYSRLVQEFTVKLRSGDDLFDTHIGVAANVFLGPLKVLGGSGTDTYDKSPLNTISSTETTSSIEIFT